MGVAGANKCNRWTPTALRMSFFDAENGPSVGIYKTPALSRKKDPDV